MCIYVTVFLSLFLVSFFAESYAARASADGILKKGSGSKAISVLSFVVLTVVMGCRSMSVGADTYQYYLKYLHYDINGKNTEFLYQFVNDLFSNLGIPWQIYLLIVSAVISYATVKFVYEYSPDPSFSILLYMTIGLFSLNMSGIRQSLAIAICLLGFIEFDKRNNVPLFLIFVGIAFLFHNSAVVMIAIIPLSYFSRSKWFIAVCVAIIALAFPLCEVIVPFLYQFAPGRYQSSFYDINSGYDINPLALGLQVAPAIFYFFCSSISSDREEKNNMVSRDESTLLVMSLFCVFLYVLSFSSASIGRLAFYYQMANSALVPLALNRLSDARMRFLFRLSISCLAVAAFIISMPGGSSHIDNYTFYFE